MLPEIKKTILLEGGYVNDPNDKGGETRFGISKRNYPNVDILNLREEEAAQIYERDYWGAMKCDQMPKCPLRWKLFDCGVNCGQRTAAKFLQMSFGLIPDGIIGMDTLNTAKLVMADRTRHDQVLNEFMRILVAHYEAIVQHDPAQNKFLNGWLKRARIEGEEFA